MSGGFGAKTVESPQRKMQMVTLKKAGLGTPTLDGSCAAFCTITDNGVGDYTINLKSGVVFTQIPEAFLTAKTSASILHISAVTISSIRVLAFAVDGTTPKEANFDVMIVGSLARDLVGP